MSHRTRWRRWRAARVIDYEPGGRVYYRGDRVLHDGGLYRVLDAEGHRLWVAPATLDGAMRNLDDALGDLARCYAHALGVPALAALLDRLRRKASRASQPTRPIS